VQQVSALIRFPTWLKNGLINAHFGPFGDGVNPIYTRSSVHPRLVDVGIDDEVEELPACRIIAQSALRMTRGGGKCGPGNASSIRELIVRPSG
jgi:hypothetical protein